MLPENALMDCWFENEKKQGEKLKLWLDDIRNPPDDTWVWVKNAKDALELFRTGPVSIASFDFNLGGAPSRDYDWLAPNGGQLLQAMAAENLGPEEELQIHTDNERAANQMVLIAAEIALRRQKKFRVAINMEFRK